MTLSVCKLNSYVFTFGVTLGALELSLNVGDWRICGCIEGIRVARILFKDVADEVL